MMVRHEQIPEMLCAFHKELRRKLDDMEGRPIRSQEETRVIVRHIADEVSTCFMRMGLFHKLPRVDVFFVTPNSMAAHYSPEEISAAICPWGESKEIMDLWDEIRGAKNGE